MSKCQVIMTKCHYCYFGILLYNWFYKDKLKNLIKEICWKIYLTETDAQSKTL